MGMFFLISRPKSSRAGLGKPSLFSHHLWPVESRDETWSFSSLKNVLTPLPLSARPFAPYLTYPLHFPPGWFPKTIGCGDYLHRAPTQCFTPFFLELLRAFGSLYPRYLRVFCPFPGQTPLFFSHYVERYFSNTYSLRPIWKICLLSLFLPRLFGSLVGVLRAISPPPPPFPKFNHRGTSVSFQISCELC